MEYHGDNQREIMELIDQAIEDGDITINDLIEFVFDDLEYLTDSINGHCKNLICIGAQMFWDYKHTDTIN